MRPEDVARYLKDHPEFFENFADMIADISIPHPHGGRAIPISERQIVSLRERNKVLEGKLHALVDSHRPVGPHWLLFVQRKVP